MSRSRFTWTAAASAALIAVAAAVIAVHAEPARSDDGEDEAHVPPSDFEILSGALANWDVETEREAAIAAYLGASSRDAAFAPLEDPSYLETR